MTTQTFDWTASQTRIASGMLAQARALETLGRMAFRAAVTLVPAMAILVAASWAISTPDMLGYFHAVLWSAGFACYAMAVEAESAGRMLARLAIGLTVQVLASLSAAFTPEFGMVAAAILAVSAAAVTFKET